CDAQTGEGDLGSNSISWPLPIAEMGGEEGNLKIIPSRPIGGLHYISEIAGVGSEPNGCRFCLKDLHDLRRRRGTEGCSLVSCLDARKQ
ncbi:hypothetical protein, partial [Mesorhizobium helmanticense]|uniref:hypothetical protein n=1 Tax=Mesorhizobium helmanticense TaxID=1776423 RepID=UPI001ABF578D